MSSAKAVLKVISRVAMFLVGVRGGSFEQDGYHDSRHDDRFTDDDIGPDQIVDDKTRWPRCCDFCSLRKKHAEVFDKVVQLASQSLDDSD